MVRELEKVYLYVKRMQWVGLACIQCSSNFLLPLFHSHPTFSFLSHLLRHSHALLFKIILSLQLNFCSIFFSRFVQTSRNVSFECFFQYYREKKIANNAIQIVSWLCKLRLGVDITTSNLQHFTWLSKLGKPLATIVVESNSNKSKGTKGSKSNFDLKGNKDLLKKMFKTK